MMLLHVMCIAQTRCHYIRHIESRGSRGTPLSGLVLVDERSAIVSGTIRSRSLILSVYEANTHIEGDNDALSSLLDDC